MKAFSIAGLLLSLMSGPVLFAEIRNIQQFLNQCPQSDAALPAILQDFTIRRNGTAITALPACTEPISAMPISAYSDELIALQTLRAIYHMDRGQSGHLPWTTGSMYEWMKSRIGGINIENGGFAYCCNIYDFTPVPPPPPGTPPPPPPPQPIPPKNFYIVLPAQDDFNRDFDRTWRGMSGQIALVAHEVRHRDDFPHSSCCAVGAGSCDDTFDPARMSPYGTQYWLNKLWLDGTINVGIGCLAARERVEIASWLAADGNSYAERFCETMPPVLPVPSHPGGPCPPPPRRRSVKH